MCHMDWEIALFLTLGSTKWEGCEKHKMTSQEQKVNTGSLVRKDRERDRMGDRYSGTERKAVGSTVQQCNCINQMFLSFFCHCNNYPREN